MNLNDTIKFIRGIWFFSILDDDELFKLIEGAELKFVETGELVFDQGDKGDKFYIVYNGKVRIIKKDKNQKELNLGICTRKDHFGETALISDKPRNAAARAVEDSILISIDKELFNKYIFSKHEIREHFDKFIKFTSVHQFLKSCTNLSALSPKELKILIKNFKSEYYKKDEVIFRQASSPEKFYLIETGKVKVIRWQKDNLELINFLQKGDIFGEKALAEHTSRTADVVCLTDCHLFSLSKKFFNDVVSKSPTMKKVIEDRINSYIHSTPPIPYKEVIKQELSAYKDLNIEDDFEKEHIAASKDKKKYLKKLSSFYYQKISFPFTRQLDQMSCGTTCLMMIAKYYGKEFSSNRLRDLANVDRSGSSLSNLAFAAEQLGFATRGIKLDYDNLLSVHHPCIVHWQGYHYIVVYKANDKFVWVADPAIGLKKYSKKYFLDNTNGVTLICEPTPKFEIQREDKSSYKNFLQFISPYKHIIFEIFLASILLNIFGLATPIFTQILIDKVFSQNNVSLLNIILIGMIIVLTFKALIGILRQYLIVHTGMKIDLSILTVFYKHIFALPLRYFKVRKIEDFISQFSDNLKLRDFFTYTALTLIFDTLLIVIYFLLMIYYSVNMAFIAAIFVFIFVLIIYFFTPLIKKLNIDSSSKRYESKSYLLEAISAIDLIKTLNIEYPVRWKWENKYIKSLNADFKIYNTSMYFKSVSEFVGALSIVIIIWYGAIKVMHGYLTVGELIAFMILLSSLLSPVYRTIAAWNNLHQTFISLDRLNEVFYTNTENFNKSGQIVLCEPKGEITFENVYFKYATCDDSYILSNINLKIEQGQKVAIVGRAGSGKTTLVNLIASLYDVTEGKLLIDGHNIRDVNLSSLRQTVGMILQENLLLSGTIRDNISIGDPDCSIEKVIHASKLAHAHDFISTLPMGYDTKIGENWLKLSDGQKKRISIARVLYRNPKIIIFDEVTNILDTESEQIIQKNMNAIIKDKTSIFIAHKINTIKNADNIFVLDNGEIVEQGTHEDLMKVNGLYHFLYNKQMNL